MNLSFLIDTSICDTDSSLLFVLKIVRWVIRILQFAVPFALIVFGSLDFFKAVIAGDEKQMREKKKPFIQRVVAAVIVLVLPSIVNLIIANIKGDDNSFTTCWKAADPSGEIELPQQLED